MANNTHIEWTDATWNPITGCSVVSPGCTNCYAMKLAGTRLKHHPSRKGLTKEVNGNHVWTGEVRLNKQWLEQPLKWRKPRMIFVCAHGDLFHESVPDEWIEQVFAVMALSPQHTFQVLTKRADRMRDYLTRASAAGSDGNEAEDIRIRMTSMVSTPSFRERNQSIKRIPLGKFCQKVLWPLPNVWIGVSVENQSEAFGRTIQLMKTPAAIRFLSIEPMLEAIDLEEIGYGENDSFYSAFEEINWEEICSEFMWRHGEQGDWEESFFKCYGFSAEEALAEPVAFPIDWVICGGESGSNARPFDPLWARDLMMDCARYGVPFFMKQMSGRTKAERTAIPDDLMVRQWPSLEAIDA